MRIALVLAISLIALSPLAGCAPSQEAMAAQRGVERYRVGDFAGAAHDLDAPARKTDENFVLNNVRLGSAALAEYDLREAESAFLRAYEVLNSVNVNDGGRSLGAAVVSENIKVWKGEPFERAMANFYLGLVYYMRHDYQNARAAFENSLFKLRDYGEGGEKTDAYRDVESNFALGYLMLARSWQRLGDEDKARRNFERAAELQPFLAPLADPALNAQSNLLLVVDYSRGPDKVTSRDGAFVGFAPTPGMVGPVPLPAVIVDGRRVNLDSFNRPTVDLLALAQDRRWEDIDTIRAVKTTLGTGLIAGGAYESFQRNQNDRLVGLGLLAGGLLLKGSSQADVRQWEMLPRSIFLLPLRVEPGTHDITVDFPGRGLYQTWRGLVVPPEGEATYYFHMQRHNPGPFTWPPPAVATAGQ